MFLAATLAVIAVNAAANIIPINGVNTGELSARYPTGFTPAGWVFSIWSLIYLGLLALSVWALRADGSQAARLERIRGPYLASCAANAAWILVWHYQQVLASLVVMLGLLASLAVVFVRLRQTAPQSIAERVCVDLPFSLYLGWITAATIVNFGAWRFDVGTYPFGLTMDQWALVSVTLATAVYVGVGVLTRDPLYVAVFAWAALGIVYQTLEISQPVRIVAAAACAVAALLTAALTIQKGTDLFSSRK
jgi:tryptophan-rich sensory protein